MWGLALVPTVSHALAAFDGTRNAWAEVCSSVGGLRVLGEASSAPDGALRLGGVDAPAGGAGVMASLDHCPLCSPAGGQTPLPAGGAALPLPVDGADFLPALFDAVPRPLFAWAAVQARAPPSTV